MENQIKLLKSGTFNDELKNPLLLNFTFEKMQGDLDKANDKFDFDNSYKLEKKIRTLEEIRERESFLIYQEDEESSRVKIILMESALSTVYSNSNIIFEKLEKRN